MVRRPTSGKVGEKVAKLRVMASFTADTALTAPLDRRMIVLDAAKEIDRFADGLERRSRTMLQEPAIVELPWNATTREVKAARSRQSTRHGTDVFLPNWSLVMRALPNAFLRSALFSSGRSVQTHNASVLSGVAEHLIADEKIASLDNLSLTLSGYRLCQFDRLVYATCLDYYRDTPLCPEETSRHKKTTFYEFSQRMGNKYSVKAHGAVRASLLRLSLAQLRMRYERLNIEVPKLLSVSFEDGEAGRDFKGSDMLLLRVTVSVAELFGPGSWTAVEDEAVRYDGLRGWLASFYAGHAGPRWVWLKTLQRLSGYESHPRNFKTGLVSALDKLKDPNTPAGCHVKAYHFSKDGTRICVVRSEWGACRLEPFPAESLESAPT